MSHKTLMAYRKAFELAMKCFEAAKSFPAEERYGLKSQLLRSSRSVCAQIAEGYRKRSYPKYFVSKLIDADGENSETDVWIDFAVECDYIINEEATHLKELNTEVGKLLNYMIEHPQKFGAA